MPGKKIHAKAAQKSHTRSGSAKGMKPILSKVGKKDTVSVKNPSTGVKANRPNYGAVGSRGNRTGKQIGIM